MGNFIQIDPRMFDRGPRTSMLVGQAVGNMAQKAGDAYLQGKIQNMLAKGQQRESARGIASLYPREYQKQVEDAYSQVPLAYHGEGIKQAQEFMGAPGIDFSSGVPSSFLGRVGPTPMQPPISTQPSQMQQGVQRTAYAPESSLEGPKPVQVEQKTQPPTSTAVASNIDALQRMGQGLPPPSPTAPMAGRQTTQPENIPLEDLTAPEVNKVLSTMPKRSDRDAFIKAVGRAQDKKFDRDYKMGKLAAENEKVAMKKEEMQSHKTKELEQKNVQDFIQDVRQKANVAIDQRPLLSQARNGIKSMDSGFLSPDNLAELTHIDQFRTAQGESLRSAVKEYWLGDIAKITGQGKNQMLEKALQSILPSAGKSKAANLALIEGQQLKNDLDVGKWAITQELLPKYTNEYGVPAPELQDAVMKRMIPYADEVQNHAAFRMQRAMDQNSSLNDLQNLEPVKNTYLTPEKKRALIELTHGDREKAIKVALKLGYKIPEIDWIKGEQNE